MTLTALTWAVQQRDISPTEKIVLLDLAARVGTDLRCAPTIEDIAARCNIARRTTQRMLRRLEDRGLLSVRAGPVRSPTAYQLHMRF